jgi:hypothetical protein
MTNAKKWLPPTFCREPDRPCCVADELGDLPMPSAEYFRRQADICLRLSLIASDDAISARLVTMAKEYLATSEALEKPAGIPLPYRVAGAAPEGEGDHRGSDFALAVDVPGTSEPGH